MVFAYNLLQIKEKKIKKVRYFLGFLPKRLTFATESDKLHPKKKEILWH